MKVYDIKSPFLRGKFITAWGKHEYTWFRILNKLRLKIHYKVVTKKKFSHVTFDIV